MDLILLKTPDNFSFRNTIYSHGWADLLPFQIKDNPLTLSYCLETVSATVYINISAPDNLTLAIHSSMALSDIEKTTVKSAVERMFRLNEDYSDFYKMADTSENFRWIGELKAGRMLRGASLWEDMVKMLCTTNCTWRLTQLMTENLVSKLGKKCVVNNSEFYSFPHARSIAGCDEQYLRSEIKMGYRAPYLLELAHKIGAGRIELSDFEKPEISSADLYKMLRKIKGFGDYAVSNLLKLLGKYDYLGADSWSRQKFEVKYNNGIKCDDKEIMQVYQKYGKWAGLFFWLDVSEEWYQDRKPW